MTVHILWVGNHHVESRRDCHHFLQTFKPSYAATDSICSMRQSRGLLRIAVMLLPCLPIDIQYCGWYYEVKSFKKKFLDTMLQFWCRPDVSRLLEFFNLTSWSSWTDPSIQGLSTAERLSFDVFKAMIMRGLMPIKNSRTWDSCTYSEKDPPSVKYAICGCWFKSVNHT